VRGFLLKLAEKADQLDPDKIKHLLKDAVPEYRPPRNQFTALATDQVATRRESETLDERNGGQPGPKVEIQDTVHWDEGVVAAK